MKKKAAKVAVGEQFRLWLSVSAPDCNDPIFAGNPASDDSKFELYGELKVDGKLEWKAKKEGAHAHSLRRLDLPKPLEVDPRKQGFTLNSDPQIFMDEHEIFFDTNAQGNIARIAVKLWDRDDPDSTQFHPSNRYKVDFKDDVIGDYKIDLDLGKLGAGDGHYYWFWSGTDESGNKVGTNLYLLVEHVKTIYGTESEKWRAPVVEPKIIDKKFPGKVVGPGPIVSKPNSKKSAPAQTK